MEEYYYNWENCPYRNRYYYEPDTGYAEYECDLIKDFIKKGTQYLDDCDRCPFVFKYKIERN